MAPSTVLEGTAPPPSGTAYTVTPSRGSCPASTSHDTTTEALEAVVALAGSRRRKVARASHRRSACRRSKSWAAEGVAVADQRLGEDRLPHPSAPPVPGTSVA